MTKLGVDADVATAASGSACESAGSVLRDNKNGSGGDFSYDVSDLRSWQKVGTIEWLRVSASEVSIGSVGDMAVAWRHPSYRAHSKNLLLTVFGFCRGTTM